MIFWADFLAPDEQAALRFITRRRLAVAQPNAWGTYRVLHALFVLGLVSQCGRLFHATGRGDRACAALPPAQADIFEAAA